MDVGASREKKFYMNNTIIKPDIQEVVSQYTALKPAGKHLRGSCPLHAERTPSFFIKPYTQRFHCFGCGAGGDVIQFVMLAERLDFKGACDHLGIELNPAKKDWREIQRQIHKKELVQKFKAWCYCRHDELCRLYRTLQKAKDQAKTEADVERIAAYYHKENLWLQEMEILETGTDEEKLELYREVRAHGYGC
jgi:DNA primase